LSLVPNGILPSLPLIQWGHAPWNRSAFPKSQCDRKSGYRFRSWQKKPLDSYNYWHQSKAWTTRCNDIGFKTGVIWITFSCQFWLCIIPKIFNGVFWTWSSASLSVRYLQESLELLAKESSTPLARDDDEHELKHSKKNHKV
jgi:hypothetical protein